MGKYRKYSKEFKLQTAKLVTEQGFSYDQAAQQVGPPAALSGTEFKNIRTPESFHPKPNPNPKSMKSGSYVKNLSN